MGILRADRITGLGGANAITGSTFFGNGNGTAGNYLRIDTGTTDDFAFGTGDFTIEFWLNRPALTTQQHFYDFRGTTNTNTVLLYMSNNALYYFGNGAERITSGNVPSGKWVHIALVRSSASTKMYFDGTQTGSTYSDTLNLVGPDKGSGFIGSNGGTDGINPSGTYISGHISNFRIQKGKAEYTADFTPPTHRLEKTPETVLLTCNSPSNVSNEETGKIVIPSKDTINDAPPIASRFTPNSPVGFSTTTDVGSQYGSTFDGFGSFATSTYMVPPAGNTRERNRGRGIFADGDQSTDIEFINIQSMGNSQEFGDSTTNFKQRASVSSSTRTATAGGFSSPAFTNIIDFITIASTANATDFGDLTVARRNIGGAGNNTRGIYLGGGSPGNTNTIDFITIATAGNASDFGDATAAKNGLGSLASPTRAVFGGGQDNVMEYVTIATTGNATDFGDLITGTTEKPAGASSSTRGLFICGESQPSGTRLNTIQFVTIASTGNATDFGDNTFLLRSMGACTNSLRAVYGGGNDPSATLNTMSYVTIATQGNGQDFGDLLTGRSVHACGSSDSHGGIS